jgi:hypothetical protein
MDAAGLLKSTALQYTAMQGYSPIVQVLLSADAATDAVDAPGTAWLDSPALSVNRWPQRGGAGPHASVSTAETGPAAAAGHTELALKVLRALGGTAMQQQQC